jgi:hypothetical protein
MECAQDTEVPNANKTLGQHMEEKTPEKLSGRDGHQPLLILVSRVAPPERDLSVMDRDEAVIGNRHPVRVAAEVAQNVFSSAKGPFAVDDPLVAVCLPDQTPEDLRSAKWLQRTVEAEPSPAECLFERSGEFSSEDFLQDSDRQQESGM